MATQILKRKSWTRDQLLAALRLYCRTPFGKLHQRNPEIIAVARKIGRTPSAVAMKACNFASLDPSLKGRVKGLGNASEADHRIWNEFVRNPESVAAEAENVVARLIPEQHSRLDSFTQPTGPTEAMRTVRARRVQGFFRDSVLSSYGFRCALTGLAVPQLLNASHIIPWSENVKRRADPCNGICLNVLHDRAFDRGLITFDDDYRLVASSKLDGKSLSDFGLVALTAMQGIQLTHPQRFVADREALAWHRRNVFRQ